MRDYGQVVGQNQVICATKMGTEAETIRSFARDKVEWSGRFGLGWFFAQMGEESEVKYISGKGIPWHTHPDGDPRLSLEDWILFLLDPSRSLLLATRDRLIQYHKKYPTKIILFCKKIGLTGQASWSLKVARFGKFLSQSQQLTDPYDFSETLVCQKLNIIIEDGKQI